MLQNWLACACFISTIIPSCSIAQGCSDAGVCSAGSLRSDAGLFHFKNESSTVYKNSLVFTPAIGFGEQRTVNFTPTFDLTVQLFDKFHLNIKTGYNITSGNLGVSYGASDVFTNAIIDLIKRDSINFSLVLGGKFSIQSADFSNNGKVLPLSYQSGIGTNDILLGVSFNYKTWYAGAGFQHALTISSNTFHYSDYDSTSPAQKYFESNRLHRAPDVIARLEKKFLIPKAKISLGVGTVFIYHLLNDTEVDPNNNRVTLFNSKGATLNLVGDTGYKISEKLSINLGVGFPLIVRDNRPDGLTRSLVILPSIQYNF